MQSFWCWDVGTHRLAAVNLMALSPGSVFADIPNIEYKKVKRPIYPQDSEMSWAPP
jgi:microcystin degradation protein MlrC